MSQIDAVFRRGVFEPLGPVDLGDNQRVRLSYARAEPLGVTAWLSDLSQLHHRIIERAGPLPDSSPDIAADRQR